MELDRAIDLYLDHIKIERNLAPNSVPPTPPTSPSSVPSARARGGRDGGGGTATLILEFLIELSVGAAGGPDPGAPPGRAARPVPHLRAERHVTADPTAAVELPRLGRPLPEVLTLRRGRAAAGRARPQATLLGLRDAAMLELLYATGLRVSELCTLRTDDIEPRGRLPLDGRQGPQAAAGPARRDARSTCCARYLQESRPRLDRNGARTRCSSRAAARPLTRQAFWKMIGAHARRPASASASTRTSCATRSPPTCSSAAPTCARCRPCSATPTSPPPRSTPTSAGATCWPATAATIPGLTVCGMEPGGPAQSRS